MSEQLESGGEARSAGLLRSLRTLVSTLLGLVHTRLELLSNEIEEERARLQQIVLLAVLALFCTAIGVLLLTLLVVVAFWEQYRVTALALLALIYFLVAALAYAGVRGRAAAKPKIFSGSLAELAKDAELLKSR